MKRLVPIAFVVLTAFFYITNNAAYKSYFDGDDIDNLNFSNTIGVDVYAREFFSPKLDQSNFRPIGQAFYRLYGRWAGMKFPRFIFFIHAVHFLNVFLLWVLLRALGFEPLNTAFGVLFFALNMGTFEIYWKPMYVFDLFCATFTLASLLLWLHNRWILSFLAFWCAFRSKEVAIALPAVLAALEYTRGTRRWKQLIPFFLVSFSFGLQAIFGNRTRDNDYSLRFTFAALKTCLTFYGNRILVIPYGGLIVTALLFVKDKRARLGLLAILLFMGPMLFLPGRLFGAYLYVPLIGLAIAAAALSHQAGRVISLILVLLWLPLNYRQMRIRRHAELALADQNRDYMRRVTKLLQDAPATNTFIFDKSPDGLHSWGVRAAARYARHPQTDFNEAEIRTKEAVELAQKPNLAFLIWIPGRDRFYMVNRTENTPDVPYIAMNEQTPLWQLGDGWHGLEVDYQWTNLQATAHVARPANARQFEVLVNVGPDILKALHRVKLEVELDGVKIGEQEFETSGWKSLVFDAPPSTAPAAQVQFKASPGYFSADHNPADALGIAIGGFGFPTPQFPARVQPEVAKFTRVCAYDRAGYGGSDAGPMPRTSWQIAAELHRLLALEKPPYIFVASSFGGYTARVFNGLYADEVSGIVLADCVQEDQYERTRPSPAGALPEPGILGSGVHPDRRGKILATPARDSL